MKIMGSLGDFIFGLTADATYTLLTRTSDGGWVNMDRANQQPSSQNTGQGLQTMQIRGEVLGLIGQEVVQQLRDLQATLEPQPYVKGNGDYLGLWKINKLNESQKGVLDDGNSMKTEFTLDLEQFIP